MGEETTLMTSILWSLLPMLKEITMRETGAALTYFRIIYTCVNILIKLIFPYQQPSLLEGNYVT